MRTVYLVLVLASVLAACGEPKQDVKNTVFAPQVEALEKARAVQDTLKQGGEKKRAVIEPAESSGQTGY